MKCCLKLDHLYKVLPFVIETSRLYIYKVFYAAFFILHMCIVIYCRFDVEDFMAQRFCESGDLVRKSNF